MAGIKQVKHGPVTILIVESSLTGEKVQECQESIQICLETGSVQIILNLQLISFIDSRALEMLLNCSRLARRKGGALKIAHITGVCHDVFVVTRLTQVLEIYPDIAGALQSFL